MKEIDYKITVRYSTECPGGYCENGIPEPNHTCPYAAEIHYDETTMCNCCDECAHQCAMDI